MDLTKDDLEFVEVLVDSEMHRGEWNPSDRRLTSWHRSEIAERVEERYPERTPTPAEWAAWRSKEQRDSRNAGWFLAAAFVFILGGGGLVAALVAGGRPDAAVWVLCSAAMWAIVAFIYKRQPWLSEPSGDGPVMAQDPRREAYAVELERELWRYVTHGLQQ